MIGQAFTALATAGLAFAGMWGIMWLAAGEERQARIRRAGGTRWGHVEPPTRVAPSALARFARWGPDLPDALPPCELRPLPPMPDRPESPV